MDVQSPAAQGSAPPIVFPVPESSATVSSATAGSTSTPDPGEPGSSAKTGSANRADIGSVVAKLFGPASAPKTVGLDVSYRVAHHPNEIITVFSDPKTGKEVAQFPPEILVQIAEFFDQQSGVTLDRNA